MLAKRCPTCGKPCNKNGRCYQCRPGGRYVHRAPQQNGVMHEPEESLAPDLINLGPRRKSRVFWTKEERENLVNTALAIRNATGLTRWRKLLYRAQEAVLPEERRRRFETTPLAKVAWFREPIMNAPPLPAVRPEPVPEPTPEPVATPEPPDVAYDESPPPRPLSVKTLLEEVTTGDLVAVLAKRLYEEMAEGFSAIGKAVFDLERRQRRDRALLHRMASDLGVTVPTRRVVAAKPSLADELKRKTDIITPQPPIPALSQPCHNPVTARGTQAAEAQSRGCGSDGGHQQRGPETGGQRRGHRMLLRNRGSS